MQKFGVNKPNLLKDWTKSSPSSSACRQCLLGEMWSPVTCPVREAAVEALTGLKNEVMKDVRSLLLVCVNLNCVVCTKRKAIYKVQNKTSELVYETCLTFVVCNYREWYLISAQDIIVALQKHLQYRSIIVATILIISQLNILGKINCLFARIENLEFFWWKKPKQNNNQPTNQPTSKALVSTSNSYFHYFSVKIISIPYLSWKDLNGCFP